ncbi:protoporphyrinogen oxidase [Streptomyces chrestomyceticus JCM 4735]|uniref:Coproporphyrinogen III oxidase n=1 Tax=Streptomyces chrestomyceticus JCM 4735 TaxID=1306181 RepID=A0A7U9L318_9ACTN|nr:protoporphyrinogen oxidase [Streptomyces chrestomyceticus]GCD40124.1 protoporphyrinogen oxidase [Streptomyces chrestomyceticus JCM 4735]
MNASTTSPLTPSLPEPEETRPHIVVVGGGIAGLTAAARLSGAAGGSGSGARVTLLESAGRLGGKLLCGEVGGVPVDLGAEALFTRQPSAVDLAREVGLGEELEAPATVEASLWTRGALRPLPRGHLMGIPADLDSLAACGVLSADGLARARQDLTLPRTDVGDDIAVGRYVAARLGQEVVDRLVEPLLGGVYAGHADRISLRAALPHLLPVAREERSLLEGIRAMRTPAPAAPKPGAAASPFRSVRGGLGRLPLAVAQACRAAGVDIRTATAARTLRRTGHGWRLTVRNASGEQRLEADAVVLAVPAPAAARLLADEVPAAAAALRGVEYADMALVTLVFDRADLPGGLPGSGFLVPPVDGHLIKAATFPTGKWAWPGRCAPDKVVVRTSIGRHGEDTALRLDDKELVARSRTELSAATGLTAVPNATAVTRWATGLPQYTVGHVARMGRVREHVAQLGTLAVCGAAYDGVGITSCVEGAGRAAEAITASLGARRRG